MKKIEAEKEMKNFKNRIKNLWRDFKKKINTSESIQARKVCYQN